MGVETDRMQTRLDMPKRPLDSNNAFEDLLRMTHKLLDRIETLEALERARREA